MLKQRVSFNAMAPTSVGVFCSLITAGMREKNKSLPAFSIDFTQRHDKRGSPFYVTVEIEDWTFHEATEELTYRAANYIAEKMVRKYEYQKAQSANRRRA